MKQELRSVFTGSHFWIALAALPHALSQVEEIRMGFPFTKAMRSQATAIRMRDERAAMLSKRRLAEHTC
jgi:hypothetical protein